MLKKICSEELHNGFSVTFKPSWVYYYYDTITDVVYIEYRYLTKYHDTLNARVFFPMPKADGTYLTYSEWESHHKNCDG